MAPSTERRRLTQIRAIAPIFILANAFLIIQKHLPHAEASTLWNNDTSGLDDTDSETLTTTDRRFRNLDEFTVLDFVFLGCILMLGLELNCMIIQLVGDLIKRSAIPVRGQHLDYFSPTDRLFIAFNKAATPPFVYFLVRYMFYSPNAVWDFSEVTVKNTLFPIPVIIVIFDFFYTLLHWALHMKFIYPFIHQHHHRQKAPSRATEDAVNVHPVEFFLGEYNHLFAVFIITHILGMKMHIVSIFVLLVLSGFLAGLNHTRHDIVLEVCGCTIYDSKIHDVHHRLPRQNYGQYITLWDKLFGTFLDYNENDRINPRVQLDPATGKTISLEHARAKLISIKVEKEL